MPGPYPTAKNLPRSYRENRRVDMESAPTVYHIVTNKKHRLPSTGKRCLFIKLSD